ncbi:MAG: hypothetical protein SVO26_03860 [Chloroflexota bacterium]|nr:hypothetical protein [Chloroflexota bacterium]
MEAIIKAIETAGIVDEQSHLQLDAPLPVIGPTRVRVIVLIPEEGSMNEVEWLKTAANNPAFDFLRDSAEDIYTLADGEPFHDEG